MFHGFAHPFKNTSMVYGLILFNISHLHCSLTFFEFEFLVGFVCGLSD